MKHKRTSGVLLKSVLFMLGMGLTSLSAGQPVERVLSLAQKETPAVLETLKELTAIESGSRELAELDRIARVLAGKLRALGAKWN